MLPNFIKLLFQNISTTKNHPCCPRSHTFSHSSIKLGYVTFCWFCGACRVTNNNVKVSQFYLAKVAYIHLTSRAFGQCLVGRCRKVKYGPAAEAEMKPKGEGSGKVMKKNCLTIQGAPPPPNLNQNSRFFRTLL